MGASPSSTGRGCVISLLEMPHAVYYTNVQITTVLIEPLSVAQMYSVALLGFLIWLFLYQEKVISLLTSSKHATYMSMCQYLMKTCGGLHT